MYHPSQNDAKFSGTHTGKFGQPFQRLRVEGGAPLSRNSPTNINLQAPFHCTLFVFECQVLKKERGKIARFYRIAREDFYFIKKHFPGVKPIDKSGEKMYNKYVYHKMRWLCPLHDRNNQKSDRKKEKGGVVCLTSSPLSSVVRHSWQVF